MKKHFSKQWRPWEAVGRGLQGSHCAERTGLLRWLQQPHHRAQLSLSVISRCRGESLVKKGQNTAQQPGLTETKWGTALQGLRGELQAPEWRLSCSSWQRPQWSRCFHARADSHTVAHRGPRTGAGGYIVKETATHAETMLEKAPSMTGKWSLLRSRSILKERRMWRAITRTGDKCEKEEAAERSFYGLTTTSHSPSLPGGRRQLGLREWSWTWEEMG